MRRPRPLDICLWGIVTLLALPLAAQDPEDAGQRWHTIRTAAIAVTGDAAPKRLLAIAADLQANRAALVSLLGARGLETAIPAEVFVFRRPADFATYHRMPDGTPLTGSVLSVRDRRGRLIAFSLADAEDGMRTTRGLLAEDLLDQVLPDPPSWVAAGLIGAFGSLEPAEKPSTIADSAGPSFAAPASVWPSTPELPTDRGRHDIVATALTRYFLQPESVRSAQYRRYLRLLRGRTPHVVGFEESFLARFEYVYEEVRAAAGRGYRFDLTLPTDSTTAASLEPIEMDRDRLNIALGDLLARSAPWNTLAAALHYGEIGEDSTLRAQALRGEGYLRQLDRRREDALALYEASATADPRDPVTALLWGWNLLDRFRLEVGTLIGWEEVLPAEIAKARSLFAAASRIAPSNPHLHHGLGATYLFAADGTTIGAAALERAHDLLPNDPDILADWILALSHSGRDEEAREMLEGRLSPAATPELMAQTRRFLLEEDLRRVTQLLQAGDLEAADAILRRAREGASEPSTRETLDAALEQIETLRRQNQVDAEIDRFEAAVQEVRQLVQVGNLDGAKQLVRPFLEPHVDEDVRAAAMQLLGEINARAR